MTIQSLPPAFVERMRSMLGDEADAFFASYADSPRTGLRINPAKTTVDALRAATGWTLEPVPWCPTGFLVDAEARPGRHPLHAAGLFYLQEPSAMAVAEALSVQPGDRVLDLAAAPGGKSTHLLAQLGATGVLVANEIVAARIKPLGENIERWGAANAILTNDDPAALAVSSGAAFDRVLLDAPCSGEGMFRKSPIAIREWSPEHVTGSANRQAAILRDAARLVRPGGTLLYSTCTFAPQENELQIAAFLAEHPGWELVEIPRTAGMAPARSEWAGSCGFPIHRAARLWPHTSAGEGHFLALLRAPEGDPPEAIRSASATKPARTPRGADPAAAVIEAWRAFAGATLAGQRVDGWLESDRLAVRGEHLFLTPESTLTFDGVRVVRPGLPLGTAKPGRFEPSHALALALAPEHVGLAVELSVEAAERFMSGETITAAGEPGWTLVTVLGWPLGWGRRSGTVVKNHYPKGLRRAPR